MLRFNAFPFSVTLMTPMEHVYILFEMVKAPCVFVVVDGQIQGMIAKEILLKKLRALNSSS